MSNSISKVFSTQFVKEEVAVVGGAVAWLFTVVGTLILGHTHLVTSQQWSTASSFLVPIIAAAVIGAITTVVRKYVTPIFNKVESDIDKHTPVVVPTPAP